MDIRIFVDGHVDDLYALSLLFPQGAYPGLNVITGLKGGKDGPMDRVHDTSDHRTYVTGEACLPLAEAQSYGAAIWVAREIISPINGYAVLADSNFKINATGEALEVILYNSDPRRTSEEIKRTLPVEAKRWFCQPSLGGFLRAKNTRRISQYSRERPDAAALLGRKVLGTAAAREVLAGGSAAADNHFPHLDWRDDGKIADKFFEDCRAEATQNQFVQARWRANHFSNLRIATQQCYGA